MNKVRKFFNNPNLFFYDYFRKKLNIQQVDNKKNIVKNNDININYNFIPSNIFEVKKMMESISLYVYKDRYYIEKDKFINLISHISFSKFKVRIIVNNQEEFNLKTKNKKEQFEKINTCYIEVGDINEFDAFYVNIVKYKDGFYEASAELKRILPFDIINLNNIESINFDIDVVYTYVDSSDENWQKMFFECFGEDADIDFDRYKPHDELKYSLRSINMYMPWVRNIYIVSNSKKPHWLYENNKIKWISHEDIFPDINVLPNFNSHSIESCIHRINGISDYFIYFNDDFIVNKMMYKHDFFEYTGKSISFREPYDVAFWNKQTLEEPGYRAASINSQEIMKRMYNYCPRYMMQHAPYAICKSTLLDLYNKCGEVFDVVRSNKKRSFSDINVLSFLYHHYAFYLGKSLQKTEKTFIVRNINIDKFILKSNEYRFFCINDLGNADDNVLNKIYKFLEDKFFVIPEWENRREK